MRMLTFLSSRLGLLVVSVLVALTAPQLLPTLAFAFSGATTTALQPGVANDINEALKILFNDPVANDVVSDSELLQYFEEDQNVKTDETTGGRYIETAQYFQLPAGVGFRGENEYFPVPEGPIIKNSRVSLKKAQGAVEMTGDVMRRVKGDMGAFLNWAERALPDLVTRLNNEIDRSLIGFGAGIKARVQGAPAGAVIPVDRSFGVTGSLDPFLAFLEGERIVFSANANGNPLRAAGVGQSAKIVDVNPDTATPDVFQNITVDVVPAGVVANDYIFAGDPAGSSTQDAAGADREFMGLLGMVDNGTVLATFQNLLRATYRLWKSIVIDGSPAPYSGILTEGLLTLADDETYTKGGGKPNLIITSRSGLRSYWNSLKSDRVLNDPRAYTGGKGPVQVILGDRTVTLKAVRKMPPNFTFGLQTDTFKRWTLGGWQWDDTPGSIWQRVTDATGRKDAYYAVGNLYKQLGNLFPRKNWRIEKLLRSV